MPSVTEDTPRHSLKNTTAGQRYPRTRCPVVAVVATNDRFGEDDRNTGGQRAYGRECRIERDR
jgi:hypothetical protein